MDRQQIAEALEKLEALRAQKDLEPTRSTSYGNETDPDWLKGTTLENAPPLREPFQQAHDGARPPLAGSESDQVKQSKPSLEARPPPEIAQGADRQRHTEGMAADDAKSKLGDYQAILDQIQERQRDQQHERDPGREPG